MMMKRKGPQEMKWKGGNNEVEMKMDMKIGKTKRLTVSNSKEFKNG
jgi:hypothetical protein